MGLFEKKSSLSRENLNETLKRDEGNIPFTGGEKFSQDQRGKIAKDVFGPKYGSEISKDDYKKAVRDLQSQKNSAPDFKSKADLGKKIEYLKRLGGMK